MPPLSGEIIFDNHLDHYQAQLHRWNAKIRKTSHMMSRIPSDLQVPVREINIIKDSTDRIVNGVNDVKSSISRTLLEEKPSLSSITSVNRHLKGVSVQARLFNDLINKINARDVAQDAYPQGKEGFDLSDLGDTVKDAFTSSFDKVKDVFENLFNKVKDAFEDLGKILKQVGEKIKDFIEQVTDEIKEGFNEFWGYLKPILEAIWNFIQWWWDLTVSLAEFTVWLTTTFIVNTWKTILITPLIFVLLYYCSKALVIYLTGTPDEVMGAFLIAAFFHVYFVTYQVDTLLDIQDLFIELILYIFLNPIARWALSISKTDKVYTDFETFVKSPVESSRKTLLYDLFSQISTIMKRKPLNSIAYLLGSLVVLKFLVIDVPFQSFRLTMREVTGFGTIIQV